MGNWDKARVNGCVTLQIRDSWFHHAPPQHKQGFHHKINKIIIKKKGRRTSPLITLSHSMGNEMWDQKLISPATETQPTKAIVWEV